MSASNWAICPRCLHEADKAVAAQRAELEAAYGKVPIDEFDQRRAAIKPVDPEAYRTFREDYEFYGATTGVLKMYYKGQCSDCGLAVETTDEKTFWEAT